jgi:zinc protease
MARMGLVLSVVAVPLLCVLGVARGAVFSPETFTLDNGMEVVVVPNHRAPVVTHMVWYKVGAADEVPGKSGIAHFLEHLMFKGTDSVPSGEFSHIVARNGGRSNAFTSQDYTAYFQSVARDRLELMMQLESDRMTGLWLSDAEVLPEREVILEERSLRTDNNPAARLEEGVQASLYQNHPYGVPIIGWEHEIKSLSTEDALDFYGRHYAPNNAILIVSGDITAEELKPLAEKYYGVLPAGDVPLRLRPHEPDQKTARRVVLKDKRVRQPSWSRTYLAPSYASATNPGSASALKEEKVSPYALDVLAEILGGGATSRLYRSLVMGQGVTGKGVAASAGAYYDGDRLDGGSFTIYGTPLPGGGLAVLEKAMTKELHGLLEGEVSGDEVEKARQRLRAEAIYARDSLFNPGRVLGVALTTGRSVADVEAWPERITAVTTDEVLAAARAVLRDEISVTGELLPEAVPDSTTGSATDSTPDSSNGDPGS